MDIHSYAGDDVMEVLMVDWNAVELNDVLSMIVWESVVIRIMFNTDQYDGMLMMEENMTVKLVLVASAML